MDLKPGAVAGIIGNLPLFIAIVIINYVFRSSLPSVPTGISSSIIISAVSFFMT